MTTTNNIENVDKTNGSKVRIEKSKFITIRRGPKPIKKKGEEPVIDVVEKKKVEPKKKVVKEPEMTIQDLKKYIDKIQAEFDARLKQ